MTELEAGLEMDALVAERVMGWLWWKSSSSGKRCLFAPGKHPEWFEERATGDEPLVGDWGSTGIPKYSTDILAAWSVLTKFGHWEIGLDGGIIECECGCFEKPIGDGCQLGFGVAKEAPLAICRAALRASCMEGDE